MTCRHSPGDSNCSSHPNNPYNPAKIRATEAEEKLRKKLAETPDSEKYTVVDFQRVGPHVVMKVLYPNCAKCSYEGNKVMVFLDVNETQLMRWRRIDPHFRDKPPAPVEAPSPAARFPASDQGWRDAITYADSKNGKQGVLR